MMIGYMIVIGCRLSVVGVRTTVTTMMMLMILMIGGVGADIGHTTPRIGTARVEVPYRRDPYTPKWYELEWM